MNMYKNAAELCLKPCNKSVAIQICDYKGALS